MLREVNSSLYYDNHLAVAIFFVLSVICQGSFVTSLMYNAIDYCVQCYYFYYCEDVSKVL